MYHVNHVLTLLIVTEYFNPLVTELINSFVIEYSFCNVLTLLIGTEYFNPLVIEYYLFSFSDCF